MSRTGNSGKGAGNALADRVRSIAARPTIDPGVIGEEAVSSRRGKGRATRQTIFRQAKLHLAGGEKVDVVLKSVSSSGAKVEFFKRVTLSDLVRVTEQSMRMDRWAKVVWQKEGSAGIKFLDDMPTGG